MNNYSQNLPNDRKQPMLSLFTHSQKPVVTTPPKKSIIHSVYQHGPVFRGLRLGMNIRDILSHFGDIELEVPIEGFSEADHLTLTIASESPDEIENFNKKGIFNYTPGWAYLDAAKFTELSGVNEIRLSFVNNLCNEIDIYANQ